MLAVRWYLRYSLSSRDVEELLAERGVEVDHVTLFRWVHWVHTGQPPVWVCYPPPVEADLAHLACVPGSRSFLDRLRTISGFAS